jgi:hypothetical protein
MCLGNDIFLVPPPRTMTRRTTFCGGELVRYDGELATVIKFNRERGLLLKSVCGTRLYAEPDECEPLY